MTIETNDIQKALDNAIREKLIDNGFDPNNTSYIKKFFSFIEPINDEYKHLIHLPDNKRIISIEKNPKIEFNYDNKDFSKNVITAICTQRWY